MGINSSKDLSCHGITGICGLIKKFMKVHSGVLQRVIDDNEDDKPCLGLGTLLEIFRFSKKKFKFLDVSSQRSLLSILYFSTINKK